MATANATQGMGCFRQYLIRPTIKIAAQTSNIVGADINELSPIKGFDSYNFLVAKLVYKIIAYSFEFKKKLDS